jgi:hypothetical protein
MESLVAIRLFQPKDREQLEKNAKADGHSVYFPTHVLEKDGEIVGYLSLNAVPLVLSWQDTKKMGPIDSVEEIGYIKGSLQNFPFICIPCDPDSPYMKFLPKAGFVEYSKPVKLFIKSNVQIMDKTEAK